MLSFSLFYLHIGTAEYIPNKAIRNHPLRESERVAFIRCYLEKRRELDGNNAPVTDEDINKLLMLTKPSELVNMGFANNNLA